MEELAAVMENLGRDACLPVLMNARVFQPLFEIVKVDAGANAERMMVRLMAAACMDMGALRNDVPAQLGLRAQLAEARGVLLRSLATRRAAWDGDAVDEAAKVAAQPLLYELVRVLGELASATTKLNDEGERRSYLVALGSPEQLKRRTGSVWLPGSRMPTWEALAEGTFRGFAAWLS